MSWLAASLLVSILLTIVLNVVLRAFPGTGEAVNRKLGELVDRDDRPVQDGRRPGVRVWIPWKGMLVASVVLTVVVNLVLWLLS